MYILCFKTQKRLNRSGTTFLRQANGPGKVYECSELQKCVDNKFLFRKIFRIHEKNYKSSKKCLLLFYIIYIILYFILFTDRAKTKIEIE